MRMYRDEKRQLAGLIDELTRERAEQAERLGYCTTTQAWTDIENWVDQTLNYYQHSGASWWERNWFPVALLTLIGGGCLLIGFINGWS